jgi:hypothetical protein
VRIGHPVRVRAKNWARSSTLIVLMLAVAAGCSPHHDASTIGMEPGATDAQVQAVTARLRADPAIAGFQVMMKGDERKFEIIFKRGANDQTALRSYSTMQGVAFTKVVGPHT